MEMDKGDENKLLLDEEEDAPVSKLNLRQNNKNKNRENDNDSISTQELKSHQPDFHFNKRSCMEQRMCKFLICCFYSNNDLTIEEYNKYCSLTSKHGIPYDEKNESHEKFLFSLYKAIKNQETQIIKTVIKNETERDKYTPETLSDDCIDRLWTYIGFKVRLSFLSNFIKIKLQK